MGYYANGGGQLNIRQENFQNIIDACKEKFDWMGGCTNIEKVFDAWGFEVDFQDGNIFWAWYPEEKYSSTDDFFEAIAPYVDNNSMLDFTGEDGAMWRCSFKDGKFYESDGVVTYPGDPYEDN